MRKFHSQFIELESRRYELAQPRNGTQVTPYAFVVAGPPWESVLNIPYATLEERLKQHFHLLPGDATSGSAPALQQYRNHLSTLNGFLACAGKTLASRVGVELGSAFDASLNHYLDLLTVSARTRRDRRAHLRLLKRLSEQSTQPDARPATLSVALRAAIARTGMAPKTLAKRSGLSVSALQRWLAGAMPNVRGMPTLRRLERELGLERDALVDLVPVRKGPEGGSPVSIAYREKLGRCAPYSVPESALSAGFREEWRALLAYKTTMLPGLERQARGVWRCIPGSSVRPLSPWVQQGGMACPTAAQFLEKLRGFFGVILHQPPGSGGLFAGDDTGARPHTLAWLAVPQALGAYIDWLTHRSSGVRHGGQKVFSATVAALLRPRTGYLWQQPEFRERLPEPFRPASAQTWQALCEQAHKSLRGLIGQCRGVSRNPVEPIAGLLGRPDPLRPVLDAMAKIEAAAAAAPAGGKRQAGLYRDALLLGMLLSNPLRARTFMSLTWNPEGTGTLRGSSRQGWRIQLEAHHLKNGSGCASRGYDVRVAGWVKPRLDAYVEEFRATLLDGRPSPYLFVGGRGGGIWKSLGTRVQALTRRYVEGSPGFGPHAFRHLVATDWLTRHPNDYLTVAELLNDRLETVLAHYAHLKRDSSFLRYEEYVEGMLRGGE